MPKKDNGNSFKIGITIQEIMQMYSIPIQNQSNLLVINEYTNHVKNRPFDLKVTKEYQSRRTNISKGWILKNQFFGRFDLHHYGILFQMFLCGAIRYEEGQDARISQSCEHTIECVTEKDGVLFDVYFFWDGMCGTNSQEGSANFDFNLSMAYETESGCLSKMDGISYLGAKTAKGSMKLADNFVEKQGTLVRFIIRYEMNLAAKSDPLAMSEVHFDKPGGNYFKIVTR
jgi:hypothetical protein